MDSQTNLHRIGDVARQTGKTVRTIHYYEELGLIRPISHTKGGFRLYSEEAVKRIESIEKLQDIGMSLADVRDLTVLWDGSGTGEAASSKVRGVLQAKLTHTRNLIAKLKEVEAELAKALHAIENCHDCTVKPHRTLCTECEKRLQVEDRPPMVDAFCT